MELLASPQKSSYNHYPSRYQSQAPTSALSHLSYLSPSTYDPQKRTSPPSLSSRSFRVSTSINFQFHLYPLSSPISCTTRIHQPSPGTRSTPSQAYPTASNHSLFLNKINEKNNMIKKQIFNLKQEILEIIYKSRSFAPYTSKVMASSLRIPTSIYFIINSS